MFIFKSSRFRTCVLLCLHLALAEWPSNFPDRSSTTLTAFNTSHRVEKDEVKTKNPLRAPISQMPRVAPTISVKKTESYRLEEKDMENQGSITTGTNLYESDDTKSWVATEVPEEKLSFSSFMPNTRHNSTLHLDLAANQLPGVRQLWHEITQLRENDGIFRNSLVQSLIWPLTFLTLGLCIMTMIGCSCCCLKRPIYCLGRQLCDYSHESATNHRQAIQLRNDVEQGRNNIQLNNIVPSAADSRIQPTTSTGAISKTGNTLPAVGDKCTPPSSKTKSYLSSAPSTMSLVKL